MLVDQVIVVGDVVKVIEYNNVVEVFVVQLVIVEQSVEDFKMLYDQVFSVVVQVKKVVE